MIIYCFFTLFGLLVLIGQQTKSSLLAWIPKKVYWCQVSSVAYLLSIRKLRVLCLGILQLLKILLQIFELEANHIPEPQQVVL